MKKINILLLFIVTIGLDSTFAQEIKFGSSQYANGEGDTLNYRMLIPDYDTLRKYPLVIFLHGAGERGDDNRSQLKWGIMNFATDEMMSLHPAYIIAPQCPKGEWWANYERNVEEDRWTLKDTPSKPMQLVMQLVNQIKSTWPVDKDRIYITGLSMGGMGTFDALARHPDLFAAAVPVCGAGDITKAEKFSEVPIWAFHGAEDPTVPTHHSMEMVEALTKAGAHPGLTIYPEVGHFSWLMAYSNHLMIEWMFRQHK